MHPLHVAWPGLVGEKARPVMDVPGGKRGRETKAVAQYHARSLRAVVVDKTGLRMSFVLKIERNGFVAHRLSRMLQGRNARNTIPWRGTDAAALPGVAAVKLSENGIGCKRCSAVTFLMMS